MVMSAEERRVANLDAEELSICILPDLEGKIVMEEESKTEGSKVGVQDKCEEEVPGNLPCAEEQDPPEDGWFCPQSSESLFSVSNGRKSSKG
jgi:hypothetical protein